MWAKWQDAWSVQPVPQYRLRIPRAFVSLDRETRVSGFSYQTVTGSPPPLLSSAAPLLDALSGAVQRFSDTRAWKFETVEQANEVAEELLSIAQDLEHAQYERISRARFNQLSRRVKLAIHRPEPVKGSGQKAGDVSSLPPSRVLAAATHEWAIDVIPDADKMPLRDLLPAILKELDARISAAPDDPGERDKLQELRNSLPTNPETFGKYLREAGIKRYNAAGERLQRTSHFKKKNQF